MPNLRDPIDDGSLPAHVDDSLESKIDGALRDFPDLGHNVDTAELEAAVGMLAAAHLIYKGARIAGFSDPQAFQLARDHFNYVMSAAMMAAVEAQ